MPPFLDLRVGGADRIALSNLSMQLYRDGAQGVLDRADTNGGQMYDQTVRFCYAFVLAVVLSVGEGSRRSVAMSLPHPLCYPHVIQYRTSNKGECVCREVVPCVLFFIFVGLSWHARTSHAHTMYTCCRRPCPQRFCSTVYRNAFSPWLQRHAGRWTQPRQFARPRMRFAPR